MDAALDKIMEARNYNGVTSGVKQSQPASAPARSEEHEKARAGLFPALVGK